MNENEKLRLSLLMTLRKMITEKAEVQMKTVFNIVDGISEFLSQVFRNKHVIYPVLFTIITTLLIDSWIAGAVISLIVLFFRPVEEVLDAVTTLLHAKSFDLDTPKIVEPLIKESIEEYYFYHFLNQSGKTPYINDKQENEMVKGVIDICLAKINVSVIYEKCRLYYGSSFEEQLAMKVSMAVTNFVVNLNGSPPLKKPYIDNFKPNDTTAFEEFILNSGVHVK